MEKDIQSTPAEEPQDEKTVGEQYSKEFYTEIGSTNIPGPIEKYGPDHYAQIGKKGGEKIREQYDQEFYEEIGRYRSHEHRYQGED